MPRLTAVASTVSIETRELSAATWGPALAGFVGKRLPAPFRTVGQLLYSKAPLPAGHQGTVTSRALQSRTID